MPSNIEVEDCNRGTARVKMAPNIRGITVYEIRD